MMQVNVEFLKSKIDKGTVKILFTDGEEIIAKILSVSEEEQDLICDVFSTNRQDKSYTEDNATLIHFAEIESVK